ncbi:unnamed protein product [Effrenium voratum]|uniref:Uncharacterized protein n=1 Tax=Effrenium voratum TaxID=2562239 RepID=A0AA36I7I4_9DINO|nr:unnamed protein product [Effrenium voratum]CAJ1381701.1 unnamed protein product [Effrenium voratum]
MRSSPPWTVTIAQTAPSTRCKRVLSRIKKPEATAEAKTSFARGKQQKTPAHSGKRKVVGGQAARAVSWTNLGTAVDRARPGLQMGHQSPTGASSGAQLPWIFYVLQHENQKHLRLLGGPGLQMAVI